MYAIVSGIPSDSIYIETSSKDTLRNLMEARTILAKLNVSTVLIVSDPLHMKRALLIAKDRNLNAYSSPTNTSMYRSCKRMGSGLRYCDIAHLRRPDPNPPVLQIVFSATLTQLRPACFAAYIAESAAFSKFAQD